jgi:tetratricopeptide (TPR) repeat protein
MKIHFIKSYVGRWLAISTAFVFTGCATINNQQETTRLIVEGNSAALKGDYTVAENSYEAALRLSPANSSAKRNLGIVLVKMGDYKRALKTLSGIQDEYKDDAEIFYFLGEASRGLNDFKTALASYQRAAKINPQDLRIQKAITWSQFRLGNLDKAQSLARRLNKYYRDDLQIQLIYASILNKQKRYSEVQSLLSSLERANFNVQSKDKVSAETERTLLMNALAESYAGADRCAKAEPLYNEVLKTRPFLSSALVGAAKCDLKAQQKSRATARLERAIKADPDSEEAYFLLGQLFESQDKSKATFYYRRFLLLAKDNPQYISEARITRTNLANLEKTDARLTK